MSRETVFTALYALVTGTPAVVAFTANLTQGSAVLANVSNPSALRIGMPVFGAAIPAGAEIATLSPTVTLGQRLWKPDPAVTDAELRRLTVVPVLATATTTAATLRQGFRTTGRRVPFVHQVAKLPALFVRGTDEDYPARAARGIPARVTINAEIWLYAKAAADQVPSEMLDPLIEAVEATLKPPPGIEAVTLGGLVHHCWIEGKVEREPGDLDGNAIAVIDVRMLVPALV